MGVFALFLQRQGACLVLSVSSRLQSVPFSTWSNPTKVTGRVWIACGNKSTLALEGSNNKISVFSPSSETPSCFHLQEYKHLQSCAELSSHPPSSKFQRFYFNFQLQSTWAVFININNLKIYLFLSLKKFLSSYVTKGFIFSLS